MVVAVQESTSFYNDSVLITPDESALFWPASKDSHSFDFDIGSPASCFTSSSSSGPSLSSPETSFIVNADSDVDHFSEFADDAFPGVTDAEFFDHFSHNPFAIPTMSTGHSRQSSYSGSSSSGSSYHGSPMPTRAYPSSSSGQALTPEQYAALQRRQMQSPSGYPVPAAQHHSYPSSSGHHRGASQQYPSSRGRGDYPASQHGASTSRSGAYPAYGHQQGQMAAAYPSSSAHAGPYHGQSSSASTVHGPTELPPRQYAGESQYKPAKKVGKIPGSAMEYLPILEARFDRLENAIDRYVEQRGQRALSNSILPGIEGYSSRESSASPPRHEGPSSSRRR